MVTGSWKMACIFPFLEWSLMPYCLKNIHSVLYNCQHTPNLTQFNIINTNYVKALKWGGSLSPLWWNVCFCGGYYRMLSMRKTSVLMGFEEKNYLPVVWRWEWGEGPGIRVFLRRWYLVINLENWAWCFKLSFCKSIGKLIKSLKIH